MCVLLFVCVHTCMRVCVSTLHDLMSIKRSVSTGQRVAMVTCSAEPRRPSSRVHPVPLHPLHDSQCRHGHLVTLLAKLQHLGETGDVQTWICKHTHTYAGIGFGLRCPSVNVKEALLVAFHSSNLRLHSFLPVSNCE